MSLHDWMRHGDTNVGVGTAYESAEESEIERLCQRVASLRAALSDADVLLREVADLRDLDRRIAHLQNDDGNTRADRDEARKLDAEYSKRFHAVWPKIRAHLSRRP